VTARKKSVITLTPERYGRLQCLHQTQRKAETLQGKEPRQPVGGLGQASLL